MTPVRRRGLSKVCVAKRAARQLCRSLVSKLQESVSLDGTLSAAFGIAVLHAALALEVEYEIPKGRG